MTLQPDQSSEFRMGGKPGCCGKPVGCTIRSCWLGQHPWKRAMLDRDTDVRCQAVSYRADENGVVRGGAGTQMQCALRNGHAGRHKPVPAPKITQKVLHDAS